MGDRDILPPGAPIEDVRTAYVIGGGIGAGKSSVLRAFADRGFVIVEADSIGHEVLAAIHPAGRAVMARWPSVVVDGEVDRARLAAIVFGSPEQLAHLESITHPAIRDRLREYVDEALADERHRGVVVEIPLLRVMAETGWRKVAVVAPEEERIERAVARGATRDDVIARISNQEPDEAWAEWADVVVDNGGRWVDTEKQIEAIVEG